MPSDSSNARDALHGQSDSTKEAEAGGVVSGTGEMQSGKTPQARILSESPPSLDSEDAARALLGELTVGSVVDGKYRVDEVLGRGAMGVVVAAMHEQLGERVALKFLRYQPRPGATDDFQTRFRREARVSARLKNEHITRVIDVGVWRERVPYMVMDYLTGTDLRQVIKSGTLMSVGTALDYAVQVCEGIAEAHAQRRRAPRPQAVEPLRHQAHRRVGAGEDPRLRHLEVDGGRGGDRRADRRRASFSARPSTWHRSSSSAPPRSTRAPTSGSIGAILYEMLCGRPPFDLPTFTKICAELATDHLPPSLVARRPEIAPELEAVVMKCFARAPDHRIQNVGDLAGELLEAVQAPFAGAVRAKIAAMLGSRTGKDALSTSGSLSLGTSGSFNPMLTQSGTGRAVVTGTSAAPPVPEATASPTSISAASMAMRPRWGIWAAIGGIALLAVVGVFAIAGRGGDDKPSANVSPVTSAPALPPTTASAAATQTPPTATASETPSASTSAPATTTRPPPIVNRGIWRPGRPNPAPATPPATAAPPPATTQPVATTPPPATTRTDPLGDRQ